MLISILPLFGLFSQVINDIAYGFFESGESIIEIGLCLELELKDFQRAKTLINGPLLFLVKH